RAPTSSASAPTATAASGSKRVSTVRLSAHAINTPDALEGLKKEDMYSKQARRATQNALSGAMKNWYLECLIIFDPNKPCSLLRASEGSQKAFIIPGKKGGNKQVKERWRCKHCDAQRTVDPGITNVMHRHSKKCTGFESQEGSGEEGQGEGGEEGDGEGDEEDQGAGSDHGAGSDQ
ncbi:hypothetical protein OC835_007672, partial [Tilletia horrida]